MGLELKRVPPDFQWQQNKVWKGYINPFHEHSSSCAHCQGSGYSKPAQLLEAKWYGRAAFHPSEKGSQLLTADHPDVWAFAERNVTRSPEYYGPATAANIRREANRLAGYWNAQWKHHLDQADVQALVDAGRLMDFTHVFTPGEGWKAKEPQPVPTAEEVNRWSLCGVGHDSINCHAVIQAELERQGLSTTCEHCNGHGEVWPSEELKQQSETWEREEPPVGEGYQMWETVSEGSPISPVFATAQGLARWLAENREGVDKDTTFEQWMTFMEGPGWAPSFIGQGNKLVSGVVAASLPG